MARPAAPAALLAALFALTFIAGPSWQQNVTLPCSEDADCDTKGSRCASGTCLCPGGQVMTSDLTTCLSEAGEWGAVCEDAVQCVPRLLVGGSCSAQEVIKSVRPGRATPSGSDAQNVCQCAQGYHYLRGQCWRSAGLGEACRRSENCYVNRDSESVSCSAGKCVCAPGFYQREYSSCRRVSTAYGQECGIDQDCQYADSACVDRTCSCRDGYAYDKSSKTCIPSPTAAPTSCTTAADCGDHSDCTSGVCSCQRGYFKQDGDRACHPEVQQTCSKDADCTMKNAICRSESGLCSCRGGYIASKDMRLCRKMSRALGWSCLHDEQCGYFGPGGRCVSKRCRCAQGTHWQQDQQYCWVSKGIGEACQASADCSALGEGSACAEDVCGCVEGYHAASDKSACRQDAVGVGATCTEDLDCVTSNTHCVEGTCACTAGYMTDASGKACQSGAGGPCSGDTDCGAKGTHCVQSLCSCSDGEVASQAGNACLTVVATLNGTCSESVQCLNLNASCTEGLCVCAEGQHLRDGLCRPKRALGQRCSRTSECFLDSMPERAECRNNVCKCSYQYQIPSNDLVCAGGGSASILASLVLLVCAFILGQSQLVVFHF